MIKPSYKFYRGCYRLVSVVVGAVYRLRVSGKESIPAGAAMVCSNHSSLIDPFIIALIFGIESHLHFIAKVELFKIPVISQILQKLGSIRVNRGMLDGTTIKSTFGYLKKDDKVVIFPEGTRTSQDDAVSAKNGAVKLAERAGVPIVPVYIPRKKPLFHKLHIVIGAPYQIDKTRRKRTPEEYAGLAEDLMFRIKALKG